MNGTEPPTGVDLAPMRARVHRVVFTLPPVEIPPEEELLARIFADDDPP